VLLAVCGKATHIALCAQGCQPQPLREEAAPWPSFEITDCSGRPLALSVECFDLTASPRSLWRSHTPDHMANRIAELLGDRSGVEVLERLLPEPPAGEPLGLVRVQEPRLLRFDREAARAVDHWIQEGAPEGGREGEGPLEGFWLCPLDGDTWTLEWAPALALSQEARVTHLGEDAEHRPDRWTLRLLADLSHLVIAAHREGLPQELEEALAPLTARERRAALRDALWAELLPSTFRVVERKVGPVVAHTLHELLIEEAVSPWQLQLVQQLDRRHPTRPAGTPLTLPQVGSDGELEVDPAPVARDDAFAILGHWGVLGREDAEERARCERDREPGLLDWTAPGDPVEERTWELETQWRPWSGVELLCHTEIASRRWKERLHEGARSYTRRPRSLARDRRHRWADRRVPDYFQGSRDGLDVPRCETTLDAELQEFLHTELLADLDRFKAAVAQGIVVDVASGDVLAVDGVYGYDISGFAPIRHAFTPGSTMKAVVMAVSLDHGSVTPETVFPTYSPNGIVVREGHASHRIREALGAPEESHLTAAEGLAHSVNAILVQVGLTVPAPILRSQLAALGYQTRPGVGLGPEALGHLPPLRRGTWSKPYAHAAVSFGHEISVSLWQHAQALATIARGGLFRPLRLLRAVEQGDGRWELEVGEGRRVLSERACLQVREMMAFAAREGTGEDLASPEHCPEFDYVGTKTGTTEKVESEVSLHVEWPRQSELRAAGIPWSLEEYKALIGKRNNLGRRRTCYTSSMCAVGRVGERELLVLVVVDEPRSKLKFGSDVAGPTAMRLLRRAHGLCAVHDAEPAPPTPLTASAFNADDLPWAREGLR